MKPLLTPTALAERLPPDSLPVNKTGGLDKVRIDHALTEATGVIVAYLPWLVDERTGEIKLPLPAQFAEAIPGACVDIAYFRLTDRVSSSEDDRERYQTTLGLLRTIAREHQGGLSGPDLQAAELVDAAADKAIKDRRVFKKGRTA